MNINLNILNQEDTDEIIMSKPTKEEYEQAKKDYQMFCSWLKMCKDKKNELIDALAVERQNELLYQKLAEKHRDTIRRYEIYEELENENSKKR